MTAPPPLPFTWDGEVMRPRQPRAADRAYVVGEGYTLAPVEDRSAASHRHYFAQIAEAFASLPDGSDFASAEHLRKAALIRAGYRDERSVVCGSAAAAERVAAFLRPLDEYAVVSVSGASVVMLTAKSQSLRAMGKTAFEASKEAVLNVVAELVGVSPEILARAA